MRRANLIAFDDYVMDATPQYSTTELNNTLGEFDSWALQAVVDDPKNADSITIQLETSADGRNWSPKNAQPEVSGPLGAGTTTVLQGRDPGTIGAGMTLVRLKVTLFGSLAVPSAHVKIWIRGGDQAGPFIPRHLPGCSLWLRADLGITLNGSNVSAWGDQSGNGSDASQDIPANQPPYVGNAMNGLPALQGDGAQCFMTTSAFTLGGAATLFVVAQPLTGTQPSYARLIEQQHLATYYLGVDQAGTGYKLIVDNDVWPYGVAEGGAVSSGASTIVTGLYSSPTGSLYVNGLPVASDTFTAPVPTSLPLFLMKVYSGAGGFWNGYLAEVIVYDRALSAYEQTLVHRYLGARYGIVVP